MSDTLPLWSISPNWSEQVTERIEFMTSVMTGTIGHEQRPALRYLPRRSIEATYTPVDEDRTFALLALQRKGSQQWRVPLWFDSARLTATAAIGATTLYLDTVNHEYRGGDFAYLVGADAFSGERVEVFEVFADRITLADPTAKAWPAGTQIHPCRAAWLDGGDLSGITSRVASFALRFDIDTDSDYPLGVETAPSYRGLPLLVQDANWGDPVELSFEQRFDEFDPGTGPRARDNPAGRAFSVTRYSLLLDGLAEVAAYRSLLYRLRGRQRPVWVPDHGRDIRVVTAASSGTSQVDIYQAGFGLLGGITSDIADLLIGSDLPVRLSGLGAPASTGQERLLLTAPLSRDVSAGERGALLSLVRLEQDVVSINHVTAGVAKSSLAWKAFTDGRSGSAAGTLAIPETLMNDTACGVIASGVVIDFEAGTYSIDGAPTLVTDLVEADLYDGFDFARIESGVGLHLGALDTDSFPFLTAAAFAAATGGTPALGTTATFEFSISGLADGDGVSEAFVYVVLCNNDDTVDWFFQPAWSTASDNTSLVGGTGAAANLDVAMATGDGNHTATVNFAPGAIVASIDGGASTTLSDHDAFTPTKIYMWPGLAASPTYVDHEIILKRITFTPNGP